MSAKPEGHEALPVAGGGANTQASGTHTKEPWKVGRGGDSITRIYTKRGKVVCQFGDGQDEALVMTENFETNARRTVACVNACAGIELDQLESLAKMHRDGVAGIGMLAADLLRIRKQRGELTEALRMVIKAAGFDADPPVDTYGAKACAAARAALAKVSS